MWPELVERPLSYEKKILFVAQDRSPGIQSFNRNTSPPGALETQGQKNFSSTCCPSVRHES